MQKTFREFMKGVQKMKAHSNNPQNVMHVNAHLDSKQLNVLQNVRCVWNTFKKWCLIFKKIVHVKAQLSNLQNVMHAKT